MECSALSALWDDTAPMLATNLSPYGIWLGTTLALEVGEQMVLSFRPPHWPKSDEPMTVRAQVVRVRLPRRRADAGAAGMGLRFVDLDAGEHARIEDLLHGLPPPLPSCGEQPVETRETQLLVDGVSFELCAQAPLLTFGRRRPAPPPPKTVEPRLRVKRPSRRRPRTSRHVARKIMTRRPHLRLVG
jgi:hypothetical protein